MVTLALVAGIIVGLVAGYFRGWVDALIMRVMDIILAFPSLLLALVLVAVLGPGLFNAMLAIAVVLQPHFARLTRGRGDGGEEPRIRDLGQGRRRRAPAADVPTILPNCLAPLIVQATLSLLQRHPRRRRARLPRHGRAAADAGMGHHAGRGARVHPRAWWVVTFPGLAILITVLAINLIGDGLRDALDPKLKRS